MGKMWMPENEFQARYGDKIKDGSDETEQKRIKYMYIVPIAYTAHDYQMTIIDKFAGLRNSPEYKFDKTSKTMMYNVEMLDESLIEINNILKRYSDAISKRPARERSNISGYVRETKAIITRLMKDIHDFIEKALKNHDSSYYDSAYSAMQSFAYQIAFPDIAAQIKQPSGKYRQYDNDFDDIYNCLSIRGNVEFNGIHATYQMVYAAMAAASAQTKKEIIDVQTKLITEIISDPAFRYEWDISTFQYALGPDINTLRTDFSYDLFNNSPTEGEKEDALDEALSWINEISPEDAQTIVRNLDEMQYQHCIFMGGYINPIIDDVEDSIRRHTGYHMVERTKGKDLKFYLSDKAAQMREGTVPGQRSGETLKNALER